MLSEIKSSMTKLSSSLAHGIFWLLDWVFFIVSFEFVLLVRPNGGLTIFIRTLLLSLVSYLLAIAIKSYSSPDAIFSLCSVQLRAEIHDTLPWFAAIFGGIYAALYTRFSSQWAYLADLYNQQLSTAITATQDERKSENYAIWQAAFIEDAVCMHLAKKPGFCFAIYQMLAEIKIREILETDQHFGQNRVKKLILSLEKELKILPSKSLLRTDDNLNEINKDGGLERMRIALETIVDEIQTGFVFDSHFVINELIKRFTDEYLAFSKRFSENAKMTLAIHDQIGVEIGKLPRIELVGEAWSENIQKVPSKCTCWRKITFSKDDQRLDKLATDLFHVISRTEYALKVSGFSNIEGDAEADWSKFASAVEHLIDNPANPELAEAIEFILNAPPKKQIIDDGKITWKASEPSGKSRADKLLVYVRRVRNNLFHGGKFNDNWFEPQRSEPLLRHSLTILHACVEYVASVNKAYHG